MLTCPVCDTSGKRRHRSLLERIFTRAKLVCPQCRETWYWRRVLFQRHVLCPECGTPRLAKRMKYDRIDRKSDSFLRRFLVLFGSPIYHCTFCRLQFRDVRSMDPARKARVQV
jgi:hypothetical protein